jgi:hypothetical protein
MADKDAESVPYINICDSSFLKRKFREDKDIGAIVAPLDSSSFDKMLTSFVDNGVISAQAHSVCVMETALREYFFYGRDVFEEKRELMLSVLEKADLGAYMREPFPTFPQLIRDFWVRSNDKEKGIMLAQAYETKYPQELLPQFDVDPIWT